MKTDKPAALLIHRCFVSVVVVSLIVFEATICTVNAQRPERQQEVGVPGIGVTLKAGWQLLFQDGCRFAVPGSWRQDRGGLVLAPDGSNLSVRMFQITNWSTHKSQILAAYGRVNVLHEDSARRLWFEIGDKERTQHYIEVVNGGVTCAGLLEVRAATTPDARDTTNRIADSIGPAPNK
jgi:hypothetical protein